MRKILAFFCLSGALFGQNATIPGIPVSPYPTVINLSIDWPIQGDDNLNSAVTVRYREHAGGTWKNGFPLFRIPADSNEGFLWGNRHSGSIFDLRPNTEYDIELSLTDPEGGSTVQTITASTRPVPRAAQGAPVINVTPSTFASAVSSARPGDILLLAAGNYGTFSPSMSGDSGNPIVFRSEVQGGAVFTRIDMQYRQYLYFEGLKVNGFDQYGSVRMRGTEGCVVRRCSVLVTGLPGSAITAYSPAGAANAYIADNVIIRTGMAWEDAAVGANGDNEGEGIQLTGPGNVICHNFVKSFRDNISFFEDAGAINQVSIDVYNNEVTVGADDGIEADFCMGNCRVMRNRLTNCFVGMSSQPSLGGPMYFIRNSMYNIIYSPFKLHRGSIGDIALHNTVVKCGDGFGCYAGRTWSNAYFRNNLFIGGAGFGTYGGYGNGSGRVIDVQDADQTCSFDYDAFGSIGTGTFIGKIRTVTFSSLGQMRSTTSEQHGVQADMTAFGANILFPSAGPFPEQPLADLRLAAGAPPVDAGVEIPNVNDGFKNAAPDMGAYELDDPLPIYGPRPEGVDEETVAGADGAGRAARPVFDLTVYPNPAGKAVFIRSASVLKSLCCDVIDIRGSVVLSGAATAFGKEWLFNGMEPLVTGIYFLRVKAGNVSCVKTILVLQ